MASEVLRPTSVTVWSGAATDIDEGIENADGSVISANADNETAVIGFDNSNIVDADTVINGRFIPRHRTVGSGTDRLDYHNVSAPFAGWGGILYELASTFENHVGTAQVLSGVEFWDTDATAAQINALTIEITADQIGMAAAVGHQVDCIEFRVEYIKNTRTIGDLAQRVREQSLSGNETVTITFNTPSSGNLLIVAYYYDYLNPDTETHTMITPTGWTKFKEVLNSAAGAANGMGYVYKISDGTETSITLEHTGTQAPGTFAIGRFLEIEWDNSPVSIQTEAGKTTHPFGTTSSTASLTPSNATQNVFISFFQAYRNLDTCWIEGAGANGIEEYWVYPVGDFGLPSDAHVMKKNASGATSFTKTDVSQTNPTYSVSCVFNKDTGGGINQLNFERGTRRGVSRGISRGI